ncbi:hypothetical protein [Segatella copri]|uniref:Uncharacterized protein n=1 Tax=Segatella copri TaxID=165179 RepID=A0AAW5ICR6_9BACT|nr:hypothetical protein [Segatella copri]MCP9546944.1 hypothetical protein [Segatella copri]MCP9549415.1 hypothetical protein [Segatella copri]MCP9554883.1 hypothetical protein [Segatella copri]MCP9569796.1 hypothetical protein [Segatella copri]
MITTLNIPGGISPIPNAYVGFLSDTAITVLSKIFEVWYENPNNDWMIISNSSIADGLAKSRNSVTTKIDELSALNIIKVEQLNKRDRKYKINWSEVNFDCEVISKLTQTGKNKLWNACYVNSENSIVPISKIEKNVVLTIIQNNTVTAQKFSSQQERLLKILALNNSTAQKFSSQCSNFEQLPESSVQILSSQDIDVSDEFAQILSNEVLQCSKFEQSNNSTAQKFSSQPINCTKFEQSAGKTNAIFGSVPENYAHESCTPTVEWSKNDTTIEIHVSEALQDALFDIGLDNVRIKLRSDAGCIAVFQQKKEKQEEQDGKETKKEKNLPPYPYLIKEINKEKGEQEEKKEKKLMASAARPNKGGKDENVLDNDSFLDSGLDSFLEGRSSEQPSRVFSVLRSWAEDRSCEEFEYLPGYELNNILNDPELYDSDYDIVLRNTWNDIQGLYRDSVEDSPGSEKILVPVQIFKTMLYRVLEEQYEINSQFKVTEQDTKNIFGFELTEQDGEPYYIIDPDEIRDINKPIVIKPQLKSRNVFDHASERVKKLVYSECMAEVPEQNFTRAEKAIRYMTNYVEERARNKTPRAEEMTPMQFPSFLESVSKYSNLPVDDLKILFSRLQKKKRVGLFYLKFNLLVIEEIIQFNHDRNEYGKVEELYCKKMAEREG